MPTKGIMPDYPTGNILHCDVTLVITYVGGKTSVEPSRRISLSCPLPVPGLGLNGIPLAVAALRATREKIWAEAKKIIAEMEKKPGLDWVGFQKVEYQTDKTDSPFTTGFIRTHISGAPGHTDIPSEF